MPLIERLFIAKALALAAVALAAPSCSDSQAAQVIQLTPQPAPSSPSVDAPPPEPAPVALPEPAPVSIVISAVGDCTLGGDYRDGRAPGTFPVQMEAVGDDYRYPFSGVLDVLSKDDLTIANLETTLTERTSRIEAKFVFSGKPAYAQILKEGSVEVVNVANNHSMDLGAAGFDDTLKALKDHGIGFAGNGLVDRRVVKGVEIINLGFTGGRSEIVSAVRRAVTQHKRPENLVVVSFHWGVEGSNAPIDNQITLGRAAIDAGADLILGTHPHVLQGIEAYKGRHIVYSLGNFVFGGNSNPTDKDSMIYQETFAVREGRVLPVSSTILPVRISSVTDRNDYRPVLLEGGEKERVLARVDKYSTDLLPAKERQARFK